MAGDVPDHASKSVFLDNVIVEEGEPPAPPLPPLLPNFNFEAEDILSAGKSNFPWSPFSWVCAAVEIWGLGSEVWDLRSGV